MREAGGDTTMSEQTVDEERSLPPILELATGLALGIAGIAMSVSLAALLFRGGLSDGLPRAASSFVFGGGVISVIVAWRTQLPTAMATSQDLGAIVLLATATSIAAGPTSDPVATVVVILALAALATGIAMFAIGRFGLSRIVRFLPSTVVMGFLAGTGWLLMRGGAEVMIDEAIELQHLGILFGSATKLWLPGLAVALLLVAAGRLKSIPSSAIGVFILAAIGIFYLATSLTSSVEAVGDSGWLVGPFPDSESWRPVSPTDLGNADWAEIGRSVVPIFAMAFVSIIGVLLNVSGLESLSDSRVDVDNEILSAGIANIVIAPLGGLIGYHMLGDTTLAKKGGIRGPRVPITIGVMSILAALFASSAAGYVPRFVVGGLIFGVGLMLMVQWVDDLRSIRSGESLVSVAIVAVVMFFGMLAGVGIGIAAASLIFLYRYSRISPVRSEQTAREVRSSVERPEADQQLLGDHSHQLRLLRVHGFLFFGSIEALHQRVHGLLEAGEAKCIILDFHKVDGVDVSAQGVLTRLNRDAAALDVTLLWSRLNPELLAGLLGPSTNHIPAGRVFDDLDRAVEAAEEVLLSDVDERAEPSIPLSPQLAAKFERHFFARGEVVIRMGDTDNSIYIVEAGGCEATLPQPGGGTRRIRRFAQGSMFGDISFHSGAARTADVSALMSTTLLVLDRSTYDELATNEPELALELSHVLLDANTRRVRHLTTQLDAEMR